MIKLTFNRIELNGMILSNSRIDESALLKTHYSLVNISGMAWALNSNNSFAYLVIGKRNRGNSKKKINVSLAYEECNINPISPANSKRI